MKVSAGVLLFRRRGPALEVLLAHPGGPFFKNKDEGSWSIPKGECEPGEDPLACARREFEEETGVPLTQRHRGGAARGDSGMLVGSPAPGSVVPPISEELIPLGEVKQSGGKRVLAWALERDMDAPKLASNTFEMEWPPKSGRLQRFPEIDRFEWFALDVARTKLIKAQAVFLDRL